MYKALKPVVRGANEGIGQRFYIFLIFGTKTSAKSQFLRVEI